MAQPYRNISRSKPSEATDNVIVKRLLQYNRDGGARSTIQQGRSSESMIGDRKLSALLQLEKLFNKSK